MSELAVSVRYRADARRIAPDFRPEGVLTNASLRELMAQANAMIAAGAALSESEALDLAQAILEAAARDVSSAELSPEVFSVAETLLKLRALIVPERD